MSKGTRAEIDVHKIRREFGALNGEAQMKLDTQILKDTYQYVPRDSARLADSGYIASEIGKGRLYYDTPYAKRQYYTAPNKSTARHPLATMRWFEAAKAANKGAWLRVAKKAGGR